MQSAIPPGDPKRTVIAGKAQGYRGLAINYSQLPDGAPTMTTAWEPSPADLIALNAGAKILVEILGTPPICPMLVKVGEVPRLGDTG